uniref:Uncharacterized protein n=1 Tax=Thermofilum adornatum TaxID=1365176 RepID=A0A7C1GQ89_9CREN
MRTHSERPAITVYGPLYRWLALREAIQDIMADPSPETVILRQEQVERIRRERENTSGIHWGTMTFPDDLDRPSRTISSHTLEGTKQETIVIPVVVASTAGLGRAQHVSTPKHKGSPADPGIS